MLKTGKLVGGEALCELSEVPLNFFPENINPLKNLETYKIKKWPTANIFRRRQWHSTPVLLLGKSRGQRSLVGCSPWVAKSRTRLSDFTFTFHFHALEKEMATHSSILAWKIPGTREPGRLPSMELHRVGHDWSDLAVAGDALSFCLEVLSGFRCTNQSTRSCWVKEIENQRGNNG